MSIAQPILYSSISSCNPSRVECRLKPTPGRRCAAWGQVAFGDDGGDVAALVAAADRGQARPRGHVRRSFVVGDRAGRQAPDLVERKFQAAARDQLWVADITYIPAASGFLYLAVVVDAWSRRVVGWSMATQLRTELVLEALDMAIVQRRPSGVIHHSDQGCQYTSIAFGQRCREAGVRPSRAVVARTRLDWTPVGVRAGWRQRPANRALRYRVRRPPLAQLGARSGSGRLG